MPSTPGRVISGKAAEPAARHRRYGASAGLRRGAAVAVHGSVIVGARIFAIAHRLALPRLPPVALAIRERTVHILLRDRLAATRKRSSEHERNRRAAFSVLPHDGGSPLC